MTKECAILLLLIKTKIIPYVELPMGRKTATVGVFINFFVIAKGNSLH